MRFNFADGIKVTLASDVYPFAVELDYSKKTSVLVQVPQEQLL